MEVIRINQDWAEFLGSKKRTALTHYSQGKKCKKCDKFITDGNTTGYCKECIHKSGNPYIKKGTFVTESLEHMALKKLAASWLKSIGCNNIAEEHKLKGGKGAVIFDVTGKMDSKLYAVECGGSQKSKLERAYLITKNLYILPYNYTQPYLYYPNIKVCSSCGNSIRIINQ